MMGFVTHLLQGNSCVYFIMHMHPFTICCKCKGSVVGIMGNKNIFFPFLFINNALWVVFEVSLKEIPQVATNAFVATCN